MAEAQTVFTILLRAVGSGQVSAEVQNISAIFGKLTGMLTRLAPGLAGIFSVHELNKFTQEAIRTADELGKAAQRMGIAVNQLSTLALAAKFSDTSIEEMGKAVRGLSGKMVEALNPSSEAARNFRELGVVLTNQAGALKSADEVLYELADTFAEMPDGIVKTRLAVDLFGKTGMQMIPLLNRGSAGMREAQEEARQFGLEVGPEFAKNAETYRDNLFRIQAAFKGIWMQLANALLPELIKFTEAIVDFIKGTDAHIGVVMTLIDLYKIFAAALTEVRFVFESIAAFTGTFFGNLSATGNPIEAWNAAAKQFSEKLDEARRRMVEIASIGETSSAAGETKTSNVDTVRDLSAAYDQRRKNLDLRIEEQQYQIRFFELDNKLGPEQRMAALNRERQKEIDLLKEKRDLIGEGEAYGFLSGLDARKARGQVDAQLWAGEKSMIPTSVLENMDIQITAMMRQWGTLAQQIAGIFTRTIGAAVESISEGITGLVMGTLSWGEALRSIGTTILSTVIKSIVEMFTKWIIGRLAVKAVEIASSAAESAAALPGALLTSIKSYGVAALVGAAALAAVMAAMGAFETGGYTGSGNSHEVAGVVHRGEYVVPARTVARVGVPALEAMSSGSSAPGGSGTQINIGVISDRSEIPNWSRSQEGEAHIIDIVRRNWHRLT